MKTLNFLSIVGTIGVGTIGVGTIGAGTATAQSWVPQQSGVTVALRGVSAYSAMMAWASGAKGTYLHTSDGGETWRAGAVPGAADLDLRGIQAVSETLAFVLSSGAGPASRVYKTTDAGANWHLLQINPDPKGFWDAIAMWDTAHGILIGDPVNGRFAVWTTSDGENWHAEKGPPSASKEGVFAASNSSLFVRGVREAWFATGGPGGGRVFHTEDGGKTWTVAKTSMPSDSVNAGIFSLAFSDARHGIAVGGDFTKPAEGSTAVSDDGGKTWMAEPKPPSGYRSSAAYLADGKTWIVTGTSGSDLSTDGGRTWKQFDSTGYNAVSFIGNSGWTVGPNGAIAKFNP